MSQKIKRIIEKLEALDKASGELSSLWIAYNDTIITDALEQEYPFSKSFGEVSHAVRNWTSSCIDKLDKASTLANSWVVHVNEGGLSYIASTGTIFGDDNLIESHRRAHEYVTKLAECHDKSNRKNINKAKKALQLVWESQKKCINTLSSIILLDAFGKLPSNIDEINSYLYLHTDEFLPELDKEKVQNLILEYIERMG